MSVEQKLTDKNVVSATTTTTTTKSGLTKTNKKNKSNNNNKKLSKKSLKTLKNKKNVNTANVNNKNSNNKNNNSSSASGSVNGNNIVQVANDEVIEELFDFSDTDLKELDDTTNHIEIGENGDTDTHFPKEDSNKLKKEEDIDKDLDRKLENIECNNDNDNYNHNDEESRLQLQQVELCLSSLYDNIGKQNEDNLNDNELVMTLALPTTSENIICEERNIQDPGESENIEKKEINNAVLPNKDSCKSSVQISHSPIVSDISISCEADNNDVQISSSSDIESMKTNNTPESLSLIKFNESSHCIKENYDNDQRNNDRNGYENADDGDESAEPYNELLVQFLDEANQIAEARLAARRHARAEAREIRMRELERQQKEQESNADRVFDMHSAVTPLSHMRLGLGNSPVTGLLNSTRGNSMSSRRSSEDSLEEEGRSLRDIRHELKDVEERFRKAMIANAQLDNDRASQTYQIQLLKDKLEDMEESYSQLQRECKEKSRDCNALKRSLDKLSEELKLVQGQLNERDTLIADQGLVIVAIENEDGTDAKRALVTVENAQLLGSVQGSLDVRLKKFSEEKQQLQAEVQKLQEQLETYKSQGKGRGKGNSSNGPIGSDDDDYEAQREANKIISDYKYKLQKAEQEIASLQSSLARSETQVIRYKSTAEAAEKAEAELKIERRKLQRENREAMEKLEELETSNNHLLKRLDKLKNAKSALLKDL